MSYNKKRLQIISLFNMVKINVYQSINECKTKFFRRKDLTFEIRLCIAFSAMMSNKWGLISQLAKQYAISRTFVYMLQNELQIAVQDSFHECKQPEKQLVVKERKLQSVAYSLSLRLEGKCSIPSISEIMKRGDFCNCSIGSISQNLNQIGACLSNTIETGNNILYVILAVDEIFSHSRPILISVDPVSTAILRIELAESRKTEDWVKHFNELKNAGIEVIMVTSDQGQGICSAINSIFPEINKQPDTFHAISHRLGKWVNSLEKSAESAIGEEYHCVEVFESAKTEQVIQKRMQMYFKAKQKSDEAILLYENYKFLYHCIISHLLVFDKEGNPCDRKYAEDNIRIALDFMIGLPVNKIKKEVNTIFNLLDDLLNYLDTAQKIVKDLNFRGIPKYIIKAFCLAWQYQKNSIKAKKQPRHKYYRNKEKEQLGLLKILLGVGFNSVKSKVFCELDKIVQSSAIVENINSIVRTFINTSRNKINQNMLNLIMFYHNHRRYKAGKRKGKTPMELLYGKKQEKDWLELLLEKKEVKRVLLQAA
ncbi:MAG: hypothetical protein GY739_13995 [Mesoflavibacter sp.]|nr:hypothetical protein [Mesoflavibacter sp.]